MVFYLLNCTPTTHAVPSVSVEFAYSNAWRLHVLDFAYKSSSDTDNDYCRGHQHSFQPPKAFIKAFKFVTYGFIPLCTLTLMAFQIHSHAEFLCKLLFHTHQAAISVRVSEYELLSCTILTVPPPDDLKNGWYVNVDVLVVV